MDIRLALEQVPNYARMTAYERALLCCRLLAQAGQEIPGWMQIRQWIGKGSANDIHRARRDFLQRKNLQAENGDANDAANGPAMGEGLPQALSGTIQDWWQQLQQEAQQQLRQARQTWQDERDAMLQQLTDQQAQVQAHAQAVDAANTQIQACTLAMHEAREAQAGAEAALQAVDARHQAMQKQFFERFETQARQHAQAIEQHLSRAIDRLEGTQQFALHQLEVVRQDSRVWQERSQHMADQARQRLQDMEQVMVQRLGGIERALLALTMQPATPADPVRKKRVRPGLQRRR